MAIFDRASPALKEILLKLYSAEKALETDHQIYEFGSVRYHIQASAAEPRDVYLSVSTSLHSPGIPTTESLGNSTMQTLKRVYADVVEIAESPKEGYQLTLRIDFSKLPESEKTITEISSLQAVILSSQLKELFWYLGSQDSSYGTHKPVKLVYHRGETFFVIRQPEKTVVIFPMRFKEDSDVIIATTLFQELVEVGCTRKLAKAPPCTWSPVPPAELRGESFEDLSTNGGFVSFDIFSRHIEGSRLDKTVWNLLNFNAYVKHHVKCTRGFVLRKMRKKVETLSQTLQRAVLVEEERSGHRGMKTLIKLPKSKIFRGKWGALIKKIKRIRLRIKIEGFDGFSKKWLRVPKFYSSRRKYTKLA